MESERTRKVGAVVVGILVLGTVALASAPLATAEAPSPSTGTSGSCLTVDTTGPGVIVDPVSCERFVTEKLPTPPAP